MATPKKSTTNNTVFVYANLPHGQRFRLSGGRDLLLAGWPVSRLMDEEGKALPAGRYGITEVPVDQWQEVEKTYGELTVMQSGLIFAAASRAEGDAQAAEKSGLRHGLEPVDPDNTITTPDVESAAQQAGS